MKTTIRKALAAIALAVGFATAASATEPAPTVFTVTEVTERASTNFNGSAITVGYSAYAKGDYDDVTVNVSVGGHDYQYTAEQLDLQAEGGSFTVQIANDYAKAGTVTGAVVTVVGSDPNLGSMTAFGGTKYLYQGHLDTVATNGWFDVTAGHPTQGGTWDPAQLEIRDDVIVFDEDDQGEPVDYTFTPVAPSQTGEVVVVELSTAFDSAFDASGQSVADVQGIADTQGALCVITDANGLFRFAAAVGGAWQTNNEIEVSMGTMYGLRVTLNYRTIPAHVTYEIETQDGYQTVAEGNALQNVPQFLGSVEFAGCGRLAQMVGSNCVDAVDASLVADADDPAAKYADIGEALANGVTNLTLLWDTAWQPTAGLGEFRIAKGGYNWYYTPEDGLLVKLVDGTYVVVTDYWEAMYLLAGVDDLKVMYLTNALELAKTTEAYTNLWLLRDVTLPKGAKVWRDTWFNGETNILAGAAPAVDDGKSFVIEGGCIGLTNFEERIYAYGGRFDAAATNAWKGHLPTVTVGDDELHYVFAELAVPVRETFGWQVMLDAVAPQAGEELMPVKDADGELVAVVVNTDWAAAVTDETDPVEQSKKLSEKQGNGYTYLDNAILGLTNAVGGAEVGNVPVIVPSQSGSSATQLTFSLGNVSQQAIENSGARVTYRVYASDDAGGKDEVVGVQLDPSQPISVDLPESGVKYYIIEVDNGAMK